MATANPATGKTAGRHCRVLVSGADLSGDARRITAGVTYDVVPVSGLSQTVQEHLLGQGMVRFGPLQAVFSNTVAAAGVSAGSYTLLGGITGTVYGTLAIGVRAAPAIGNPAFSCVVRKIHHTAQIGSGAVLLDADFTVGAAATVGQQAKCWGVLLADGTNLSATTTNDNVDNGASSSNGALAVLHLDSPADTMSSPLWAFTVEHSTDALSWATLLTFSANGATLTSEAQLVAGTVNRYARVVATKTSGSNVRPWVNFIRL